MDLRASWPARVVAAATVAYSAAIIVKPALLARPCGLTGADGSVPPGIAAMTRSIGARDAAVSAALIVAPAGYPLRLLTAARVISDCADAVSLSGLVSDRAAKRKVAGIALGWALIEILAELAG